MSIALDAVTVCKKSYGGVDDSKWSINTDVKLQARGFADVKTYIVDDSYCVAATKNGRRFYGFRGTHTLFGLGADLDVRQMTTANGRVHQGFLRIAEKLLSRFDLQGDINRYDGPLIFTGHSMGAAIATIAAAKFFAPNLITFGSPRVGDAEFSAVVRTRIESTHGINRRFVNRCDPIPMLPTFWRYKHVCKPHYIDRHGNLKVAPTFSWMCWDRFMQSWSRYSRGDVGAFQDHAIANYYLSLRKNSASLI